MHTHETVPKYRIKVATSAEEMRAHIDSWRALAAHALEDNAYLHPDFVLTAFEYSQFFNPPLAVFVYRTTGTGPDLEAVAVFERCPRSWSMPVPHLRASVGKHGYLVRPMLTQNGPAAAFAALCDWLAKRSDDWHAVVFQHLTEESPVGQIIFQTLKQQGYSTLRRARFPRAIIRATDFEHSFLDSLSARRRQDLRRLWRRMQELGSVELRCLERHDADPTFSSRLIELESKSWKSAAGGAILRDPKGPEFFVALAQRFGARSALFSCELLINGQPFAMSQNLLGRETMFALKIAFDTQQRKLAPGILLAVESIEQLIGRGIRNADGGNANDSWLNRLWPSSVQFEDLMWSLSAEAKLVRAVTPAARMVRSRLRSAPRPSDKIRG